MMQAAAYLIHDNPIQNGDVDWNMRHDSDQIPAKGGTFQNCTSGRPEIPDATRFLRFLIAPLIASNTQSDQSMSTYGNWRPIGDPIAANKTNGEGLVLTIVSRRAVTQKPQSEEKYDSKITFIQRQKSSNIHLKVPEVSNERKKISSLRGHVLTGAMSVWLLTCFCNGRWQWMPVISLNLLVWKQDSRFCRVPMLNRTGCRVK